MSTGRFWLKYPTLARPFLAKVPWLTDVDTPYSSQGIKAVDGAMPSPMRHGAMPIHVKHQSLNDLPQFFHSIKYSKDVLTRITYIVKRMSPCVSKSNCCTFSSTLHRHFNRAFAKHPKIGSVSFARSDALNIVHSAQRLYR